MCDDCPASTMRLALGLGVLCVLASGVGILTRSDRVVGPNTPVRYDDFAFSVVGVRRLGGAPAGWTRHVVALRVENRARRVAFQFRRGRWYVIDLQGRRYPLSIEGQRLWDAARGAPDPCAGPLRAGTSATTELVFDWPAEVREPALKLTSGPLGDALDSLLSTPVRFRLPPDEEER